ncbi:MAG TPA: SRPBCC family protein [Aquaticitalea sp.]|nr:SRPBCC family protein [Aquaticitalea sp.]HNU60262.1 SRPBCC family protein [Aquaticitalea sp.]
MKLESQKQTINRSKEDVFEFLSDPKNFEQLMPENVAKFEPNANGGFTFALSGMPEISLRKRESVPYDKIVLGADGGKLDFDLTANLTEIGENETDVQLVFSGEFNAMIGMMVKGPISKFIETLVGNLQKAINTKDSQI